MSTTILDREVTPGDLIASVRAARATADAAEVEVVRLAVAWAHAHPEFPGDVAWHAPRATAFDDGGLDPTVATAEELEWFGIPDVRWDAPAAFAAANAMTTTAGRALIRDALILRHRLPRLFAKVVAGQVPVWRARRVAQAVLGKPADVVAYLDTHLAERAGSIGTVALDRLVDEAMLRLYPEQREAEQLQALDARHATLDERTLNHTGIGEMTLRADWADLKDFDHALSEVAAALARDGNPESLDVRRSIAVGVLADPAAALALLNTDPDWARKCTRRRVRLVIHLSDLAVLGLDPLAHTGAGVPVLDQSVREWCGRPGTRITVRPVLDLNTDLSTPDYRPTALQHDFIALRDQTCVFPRCTRPAARCDEDHVIAYVDGGATDTANLAPLCRHHHRLKTHAGWCYTVLGPGTYLWSDPHTQMFLRTPDCTRDVTPPRRLHPPSPPDPRPSRPRASGDTGTSRPARAGSTRSPILSANAYR